MNNKGFVSLVALAWFSYALAFISGAMLIMNNYLMALESLQVAESELELERVAVAWAHQAFSDMNEEDYCDFVRDYEVCWAFGKDRVTITIDYQQYLKTINLSYNWENDCFTEMTVEVDK